MDWWTLGILIYEMHAGIDPFSDDDTMGIYKNILKGKVNFPSSFEKEAKDAKSLIKHLLVADLSKRYGNLKEGNFYFIWRCEWYQETQMVQYFQLGWFDQEENETNLYSNGEIDGRCLQFRWISWLRDCGSWSKDKRGPIP